MTRAIAFDVTHLTHRVHYPAPAGIEKVDMAYARYFADNPRGVAAAVHYGLGEPILFGPGHVREIVAAIGGRWQEDLPVEADEKYGRTHSWLLGLTNIPPREKKHETVRLSATANSLSLLRMAKHSLLRDRRQRLPEGAIYLNVAQHGRNSICSSSGSRSAAIYRRCSSSTISCRWTIRNFGQGGMKHVFRTDRLCP